MGPYVSQFLLKDIPYGTLLIPQRQDTLVRPVDHLTTWGDWLEVQNGSEPEPDERDFATRRYIQTPRDLAHYVHFDALYEAYLNAALILLGMNAPADPGNPYNFSRNQIGFGTYGGPHILSLVTEVATRALKAVWFQKWFVHRRLRPEEFGGRTDKNLIDPPSTTPTLTLDLARTSVRVPLLGGAAAFARATSGGTSATPEARVLDGVRAPHTVQRAPGN